MLVAAVTTAALLLPAVATAQEAPSSEHDRAATEPHAATPARRTTLPQRSRGTHDAPSVASGPITAVVVDGLQRTRRDVVLDLVDVTAGDDLTAETVGRVEQALVDSDLFADVTVTVRPAPDQEGMELVVRVEEKWTLVPIPFFTTDGSDLTGGMILIESNLLGRNKQLISAAFAGTAGFNGFFAYVDPAVFASRWSTSVSAALGRTDETQERGDGTEVRSYEIDRRSAGITVGYRLWDDLRLQAGMRVQDWDVVVDRPRLGQPDLTDGWYAQPEISVIYDGTRALDVLRVGPRLRGSARYVTFQEGWNVQAGGEWGIPVATTHRLRLLASGGWGSMPVIAEEGISSRDGYRTLPFQAVTADRWGGTAVIYDLPVVSGPWGALVLTHSWELGAYDTEVLEPQPFFGPGGGFRVYLRRVAVPALGLDVAYNIPDGNVVFSFSLGAQM